MLFRRDWLTLALPHLPSHIGWRMTRRRRWYALVLAFGLTGPAARAVTALPVTDFLDSTGVNTHIQHGQPADKLAGPLRYLGVRNVRDGADGNFDMAGLLLLHQQAGVQITLTPGSGAGDESLAKTIKACRELAAAGALRAVEGPNEPNNFGGVTYQGQNSVKLKSWIPVANYQRDLYAAVKNDPGLKNYPVFDASEAGAEDDDVGLQFLTIPADAHVLLPDGTRFADFINCHNYVGGNFQGRIDNQASLAAATHPAAAFDHLYGNNGLTWREKFQGYTESELATLPKVTTETGWKTDNTPEGDDIQGKMFLNVFLAQFKAGWKHTFIYELADDADGAFGFYKGDFTTPRKSAEYLHNLTSILADDGGMKMTGSVNYSITKQPATLHDLLLEKSSEVFELIVWGEKVRGSDAVVVNLGDTYAVKVYDPTVGTAPQSSLGHAASVPLTVSDHPLILELKPELH
jgi:hypothetical protein